MTKTIHINQFNKKNLNIINTVVQTKGFHQFLQTARLTIYIFSKLMVKINYTIILYLQFIHLLIVNSTEVWIWVYTSIYVERITAN